MEMVPAPITRKYLGDVINSMDICSVVQGTLLGEW